MFIHALVLSACGGQGPASDTSGTDSRFLAPAPTAAPSTWTYCAPEDQVCTFEGTKEVRYGFEGAYYYKTATGSIACTNAAFGGDPAYGVDKVCDYRDPTGAPPPAPAPTPAPSWTFCANEYGTCNFTGTREVRYGLNGTWVTRTATATIPCTNEAFGGDPLPNANKICQYGTTAGSPGPAPGPAPTPTPAPGTWTFCANEDAVCNVEGTRQVRYGLNGTYVSKTVTGSIMCSNDAFGSDPLPNANKICEYGSTTGSPGPAPTPGPTPAWTFCANEDAVCNFEGTRQIRYGLNGNYLFKTATNAIMCSNDAFGGDPAFGANKICEVGNTEDPGPTGPLHSAWSAVIPFPIVPVAAANLPNGKILTWSAYSPTTFGDDRGQTYTAIFDPVTGQSSSRLVAETGHDMFCPGTTLLPDGTLLVNGGSSSQRTSLYDYASNSWSTSAGMNIPRGYQSSVALGDGSVLTLGGSWSGGEGGKNGEIWTAGGGWRLMPGIPIDPFIGVDPGGVYRGDNHLWLFTQPGGRVFHAGPAAYMNWIDTTGNGNVTAAGYRGDDTYSMNGNAVMYDIGKILKTGGAPAYEEANSTAASYVIDIADGTAKTRKIMPMNYARAMHNSVVLPDGKVVITGGQTYVKLFSDERSVLMAEIWDPKTEQFSTLKPMAVPRNYHAVSILLPDGRVLVGGGGLCDFNCTTNHLDAQILTPPYLFNADGTEATRPVISASPAQAGYGQSVEVRTDSAIASFALIRLSSVTHSINTDQRRVPLQFTTSGTNRYAVQIPGDPGLAPPGFYMLFALNAAGVPSVSKQIQIR